MGPSDIPPHPESYGEGFHCAKDFDCNTNSDISVQGTAGRFVGGLVGTILDAARGQLNLEPTIGVGPIPTPGTGDGFTKLRGNQGYRDERGNVWQKDRLHKDHWDVTDRKGNKIREVTYDGRELWPNGPKNKNR